MIKDLRQVGFDLGATATIWVLRPAGDEACDCFGKEVGKEVAETWFEFLIAGIFDFADGDDKRSADAFAEQFADWAGCRGMRDIYNDFLVLFDVVHDEFNALAVV